MNAILYIESASGKLIPKLSTRAQATLGSIMAFIKRAHSSGKFADVYFTRAHSSGKFADAHFTRAHSSGKFTDAHFTRAHSSGKFTDAHFTFFSATKYSSFLNSNTIVS